MSRSRVSQLNLQHSSRSTRPLQTKTLQFFHIVLQEFPEFSGLQQRLNCLFNFHPYLCRSCRIVEIMAGSQYILQKLKLPGLIKENMRCCSSWNEKRVGSLVAAQKSSPNPVEATPPPPHRSSQKEQRVQLPEMQAYFRSVLPVASFQIFPVHT